MKLSEKQRIYLVNGYDDAVVKQLNSSSRYVCNKCGTSNHGRKKYFLFNTKQNKIIKNTNGIFNDFVVYEKYLEAFHFWKNDYVVGESKIGLLYCPTYPADRLPNPFNIVQPSDPWTKRKDPKYPFGQFLNKEMLLTKSQEELDKLLVEYNKNRKNKTKAIKLVEKPISIYSDNLTQDQRIALIRRYRSIEEQVAKDWVSKNINDLKLVCLNCS